MEVIKKCRTVFRSAFTRVANQFDQALSATEIDFTEIEVLRDTCQDKFDELKTSDGEMFNALIAANASEDDLTEEISACDVYKLKFKRLMVRFNSLNIDRNNIVNETAQSVISVLNQRRFKLPQIELVKFSGDLREWLPFWSSFKKIHEATDLPPEDKFQYLLSAVAPNTRARDLVESFPATAENYVKVIDSLKTRFGRDDLLVEVYVRELLRLVLNNALLNQSKCGISTLYDKIETQLRALETLGVNTGTCSAMLYPLVESCLPEELLKVWQRSAEFSDKPDATLANRLERLMRFLKTEVEGAERISLAVEGFGMGNDNDTKQKRNKPKIMEQSIPTAAGLMNHNVSVKCVFCEGSHSSERCIKAQKFSFEEKKDILKKKRACFRCAKIGHSSRLCRERLRCLICGKQHLSLLCPTLSNYESDKKTNKQAESSGNLQKEVGLGNRTDCRVFLQTLIVKIRSEDGEKEVRAIIDSGSQRTYILKHLAQELNYQPKRVETIVHALFGGAQTTEQKHVCYDVRLLSLDGKYACKFEALGQPVICNDIPSVHSGVWTQELRESNISLSDTKGRQPIAVLIGSDIAGKILTGKKQTLPCGLVAVETLLGWVLMGKIPGDNMPKSTSMIVTNMLNKDLSIAALWQLDVLGITDPSEKKSKTELEMAAMRLFEETVSVTENGRYEIALPWLEGHAALPTNYALAKKRLASTENKLQNTNMWDAYDNVFAEWCEDGVIEEVPAENLDKPAHYLPHHPVIKMSSATTKIRPVFDASAREKGKPSLNDCLEKGINLIEQIPDLLLRFRRDKIGVTSDIKKAFLQISLNPKDRDFLRFIWKTPDGKEKIFRHKRVVFGVNCSPFMLGATIEHHLKLCLRKCEEGNSKYTKQTIDTLLKCFYVDNCVTSMSNEIELENFISEATELMAEAKFELRGWEYSRNIENGNKIVPLLGLNWNKENDTFTISSLPENGTEIITKRTILSLAHRIFDPIGYTSPATLCPKILLQEMWEEKIGWDVEVKEETQKTFLKWKKELHFLSKIEIPRWIDINLKKTQNFTLHIFCDASKIAYAAVVFLRIEDEGTVKIHLLQAKARIAPLKKMSIPRLELMAASIGARLGSHIQKTMNLEMQIFYWSDSTTVLGWIRQTEEWAIFVGNRVQEIRSLTSIDNWNYVPGHQNPADLPSRGCSPRQLSESKWWEGPFWLYEDASKWSQREVDYDQEEIHKEKKKKVISNMLNVNEASIFYDNLSKYRNNVRTIAWIYRFVHNCKNLHNLKRGELSVEERNHAEKKLIRIIQQESFSEKDNRLTNLNVFRDEADLLRLETRISNREDLQNFRYPYVLPGQHPVVKRLIFDTHVNSSHIGIQGLLSILREHYWILGGRRTIRSVLSTCIKCKRHTAKKLESNTPTLPIDRVREAACFEVTGIDFAGPLYLQDNKKAWICLFTCAVYRAIHLELVTTLSTASFIQALRRFVARRGRPRVIYSDNGANFSGTYNIFSQLNWEEVKKYSADQRICWRFNPPSAPWWGGWWERLVGLLKQLLRRVLGRANLNGEELYTVLCDCESVINSRPLTYVSNESEDLNPLTPAMFLRELYESGVPDCDLADKVALNRRFRYLQRLRRELRKRFRVEYLGQLRQTLNKNIARNISVNEIVLIGNDNSKRLDWPLGRVVELITGKDNKVRLVRVQTQHGQMLRPIQRIYPLECQGSTAERTGIEAEAHASTLETGIEAEAHASTTETAENDQSAVKCNVSRYGRKINIPQKFIP